MSRTTDASRPNSSLQSSNPSGIVLSAVCVHRDCSTMRPGNVTPNSRSTSPGWWLGSVMMLIQYHRPPVRGVSMAFLSRLRARERIPELMDDPAIDPVEHRRALAALARVNRFTNSAGALWPAIRNLAHELRRTIRVLDVATGSGDVPTRLLVKATRAGVSLEVAGCDVSPIAIGEAERHPGARFFTHDAIGEPLPSGFDVVTCSLFLHHLGEDDAGALLANMAGAARHLVLVNDLSR